MKFPRAESRATMWLPEVSGTPSQSSACADSLVAPKRMTRRPTLEGIRSRNAENLRILTRLSVRENLIAFSRSESFKCNFCVGKALHNGCLMKRENCEHNTRYVLLSDGTKLRGKTRQNLFQNFGGIYLFIS
jgi:hypothetical protein